MTPATLFISDLHLDECRPEATACLQRLLEGPAREAAALWVLGDLFEAWLGDDDDSPWLTPVLDAFAALTATVPVTVLHGNRDFLLGAGFAARSGARLATEPCLLDLGGVPTVLVHGDAQCTDDTRYQAFRAQVRAPAWQDAFLAQPLSARRAFAEQARTASRNETANKDAYLMDVNAGAVAALMRETGATRLVHGHTHRPAQHTFEVEGRRCKRWVLGDWHQHGWLARAEGADFRQEQLPF